MPAPVTVNAEQVTAAAARLVESGQRVTGWSLRRVIGAGRPERLAAVWQEQQHERAEPAPADEFAQALPPAIAEHLAAETERLSADMAGLVGQAWGRASDLATRRVQAEVDEARARVALLGDEAAEAARVLDKSDEEARVLAEQRDAARAEAEVARIETAQTRQATLEAAAAAGARQEDAERQAAELRALLAEASRRADEAERFAGSFREQTAAAEAHLAAAEQRAADARGERDEARQEARAARTEAQEARAEARAAEAAQAAMREQAAGAAANAARDAERALAAERRAEEAEARAARADAARLAAEESAASSVKEMTTALAGLASLSNETLREAGDEHPASRRDLGLPNRAATGVGRPSHLGSLARLRLPQPFARLSRVAVGNHGASPRRDRRRHGSGAASRTSSLSGKSPRPLADGFTCETWLV